MEFCPDCAHVKTCETVFYLKKGGGKIDHVTCSGYLKAPKQTNLDRLREMPVYELIDYLKCDCCIHESERCGMTRCVEGKTAWLEKEAE